MRPKAKARADNVIASIVWDDTTIQSVTKVTTKKGKDIEVHTNEEEDELTWNNPLLTEAMLKEFPEDKLKQGMSKEMESMDYFDVYEEIDVTKLTEAQRRQIIGTRWVNRWKGNEVKSRLVAQGYNQQCEPDDTYASTPLITSLKIL